MTNLFDKEFQKELEDHSGEHKPASSRQALALRPWDSHHQSESSLWDRFEKISNLFVFSGFWFVILLISLVVAAIGGVLCYVLIVAVFRT